MANSKIKISLQEELNAVGKSMAKVTAAIFSNNPGLAPQIPGKRKSAQITFKIGQGNDKRSLKSQARRSFLDDVMRKNGTKFESEVRKAMKSVIAGLVGISDTSVTVFGRSVGVARSKRRLEDEPFAKFIRSKEGAGEIGLPDPDESIRNLKIALLAALTVDVLSRSGFNPQVKFVFDQNRLLKRTPHPNQMESGASSPFFSWLSLVTGPGFVQGGTPGFGLVRVGDLRSTLRSSKSVAGGGLRSQRRVDITQGLIRASRTRGNAGEFAAIMMSTRINKGGRSSAEAFGGVTSDYRPSAKFNGFWNVWWMQIKIELKTWARRIISAAMRAILRGV